MNKIKDQFQQRNVNTLTPTLIILSILMMKMSLAKYVGKATSVQDKKKKVLWEMPENEEVRQNDHM